MREKITLDQFREIKQQFKKLINNFINTGNKIDIYVKK